MAIKPQDKARILAEAGVDPRKYWVDDNGEIIDMPEQGPVETAIKTTLHNAPRTALGFVGSALGAAGAGALATPETAGLATIPAALAGGAAGGAAGGFAGQALQEAVYPESWRLAEEARSVRAPITTKVADVGASMLLMRPSPTVFRAAARAPGEFLRTAGQLQPKTVEALANIGLGAGMSGGMAAAQGASPGAVALETALGALQVQPTWLGTKMSGGLFTPFNTEGLAQPGGLPTAEAQARFAAALEAQNAPPQPTIAPDALAQLVEQFQKQQARDAQRIEAGAIAAEGARQNEIQRLRQAEVAAAMTPTQGAPAAGSLYPFGGERPIGQTVQRGRRAAAPEVEPAVLPGDTRTIDERLAATGGAPEQQMKLTPAVQQAKEAQLRGASPVEQELAMLLSPEQHKYFRDIFKKYDTEYRDVPELDASGRFIPRESASQPSRTDISSRAYLDVYPHEALHALLSDTLNYGTARERAFTERALRELGIEVLTDANGRKSLAEGSEEALAKQVGEESVRVLAGKQKPAPMREAFSDFVDYLINDKLTPDVARRILRDRTVFGAGTRGIVARAAQRGGTRAAAGAPPVMSEAPEQKPAAQAPIEKPFEPVELPERLAPTRDMTPEQIAQVEAAREAARTPPPAAEAEAAQARRRADELAARAEQMKTLLDEQEARLRRLENAERIRQRIGELPESPLGLQRRRAALAEERGVSMREFETTRPSLRGEEGESALSQAERDYADRVRTETETLRRIREEMSQQVGERTLREEEGTGLLTQEERDYVDAQRYADTGGEIPMSPEAIGEDFLPPTLRALPAEDPRVREARQRAFENAQDEIANPDAAMRSAREAAARGERIGPGTDVTRPETVEYTGAPVPANVRAGVRRREAMLETPADLEARRIEEQLSGRDRGRDRYQPLGPERGEYKGAKLPERERRVFGRGIFAGNVEALRRTGDPQKIEFAGAMEELYARIRNYTGQYEEGIIRPLTDLSKASQQKVVEALYDESMTRQPATAGFSPDELAAHREIRAGLLKMRDDQIAANHLIEGKPAGRDPFYFPHVVDSSIIHDLSNSPESPRAKEAERQFIDFNAELFRNNGVAPAVAMQRATEAFSKFIGSLKPISVDSGFDYGAVSMPAGTKLPPTWVTADPVDGFRSYIKRFSRARAFYDVIGRDENAMRQIGRKFYYDAAGKEAAVTNPGSRLQRDPNVKALLENALGITHESQEGITPAIGRLANSLLLGNVATRLTDAATTPFKALAYLPPQYIPGLLTNLRNLRLSIDNAYKTGGVRRGDMMVVREVLGAGDRYVKGMDKIAETITKYTGSEALEKGARFLAQNIGEYIYDVNKMLADRGDKRATDFMNRVTPKWRTLAREETAQRIARLFQGNYDATNLPIWIANSPAAPFFSMMKWNIEQWNNFKRFAWEPALKGDPYALMATVLGGVAGGIAVGELREKITGKKQRVATAGELNFGFREGDKARASMEAMRKAAFLAQVTGTFGIVGELSLQAIDVAVKDKPQGFSWPAYEFVSNVIGKIANAVPAAIERPEDALLITGTAANDLAKDIVAQYRILWNAADRAKGAGEVAESNRRRDLRMSEKLRGEPTRFSPFIERDYRNERERQFDKARDRKQAIEIAKQLDARARRESATGAEYKEARRKFRTSRIVGIPSRENNPEQFYRHIQFVRNTQGAEAADQLAQDYVMLRTEQKWKSSMFR